MEISFGVIQEKGWRREGQVGSCCDNLFLTELVISRAAKGPHTRDILKEGAVGLIKLDIANEGGRRVKEKFHIWERNILNLNVYKVYKLIYVIIGALP